MRASSASREPSATCPAARASSLPSRGPARERSIVDGTIAGVGIPASPVRMEIAGGRLVAAAGPEGEQLLALLTRHGDQATTVAELGIGTNEKAKLTGNVLEDEKILGTVHVAFGASAAIGGTIQVPVHLDCVVMRADDRGRWHHGCAGRRVSALSGAGESSLLAVPNLSTGPDRDVVKALERAFSASAALLDCHSDRDHGRTVLTLAGPAGRLGDSLVGGAAAALELLDLDAHAGAHPRVGVLDVAPIVYLDGAAPRRRRRWRVSSVRGSARSACRSSSTAGSPPAKSAASGTTFAVAESRR